MELIKAIDETITFNEKNIRIIGTYDDPWFVAKDICQILDIKDVSMALTKLSDSWKGTKVIGTLGGNQDMRIINEAGLYKLIMRSNKPIAEKFQEVVCEEILPSIRKKGEFKLQKMLDEKEHELQTRDNQIKNLENMVISKQKRVKYKDKNCIYILSNDFHLENRTYIFGKAIDLTNRLTSYNKTVEHCVIYSKGCKSHEHMTVIEKMVLYKLDKYRERANRDRFILPEDKDIELFINVVNDAIAWFDDIDEYVHSYTDEELGLSNIELKEKYLQDIKDHEEMLKIKKSESDRIYRDNNTEIISEKKEYYEANKDEILESQKEYYEANKDEILESQKEYHEANKEVINKNRKISREENKEKIKKQKKIYREKYKDEINKKQKEKRLKKDIRIECECGMKLKLLTSKTKKHLNSKIHLKYIEDKKSKKATTETTTDENITI